ncbi:hypothetical protein MOQ_000536 [Trypanosoma cruzi marinkellei]|uniref:Uncharacterized protein n=1 Tax=Trypanosoma cruzi marinkellei TaxID=85056 RepID=K2NN78_TRYCR|nr:hypothetical protein MOQ_000536 [Trypanosoma cruzi marinkellei]
MAFSARCSASSGSGSRQDTSSSSTSLSPHSPSSFLPVFTSPPSRSQVYAAHGWHGAEIASPPLREKTEEPNAVEHHPVEPKIAAVLEPPHKLYSKGAKRYGVPSTPTAVSSASTVGLTCSSSCKVRERDPNTYKRDVECRVAVDPAAQRDWARSLQRCLLETETRAQELRATAERREQEARAAAEEVIRLRELTSLQAKSIEELEQRLSHAQFATAGANKADAVEQTRVSTDSDASLEGLSIADLKRIVHCAAEALRRIEIEFEAEKRRRCAIEKENNALRRQICILKQGKVDFHEDCTNCCKEERYNSVMAFVQGPLRQFLAESADLQGKLSASSTCHTSVHS